MNKFFLDCKEQRGCMKYHHLWGFFWAEHVQKNRLSTWNFIWL